MFIYDLYIVIGVVLVLADIIFCIRFFFLNFKENEKMFLNVFIVFAMMAVIVASMVLIFNTLEIKQNMDILNDPNTIETHKVLIRAHVKDLSRVIKYDAVILAVSIISIAAIRIQTLRQWKENYKKAKHRWNLDNF